MPPQADYVVSNGTGASVRSDINSQLAAIVSNNSGAVEPSTTYAFQWWADTTTGLLKIRNAANSAWVTVGTLATANLGLLTTTSAASTYLALAGGTITGTLEIGSAGSLVFEGSTADGNETTLAVTDPTGDRTITLPDATGTVPLLGLAQSFTAAQRGSITALTSASTITPDFALANNFSLTLGHNATLANPTNLTAGQSGVIFITQDASTAYTLAFGSYWDFSGGTAPTVTSTLSAVDCLVYAVRSSTSIHAQLITNLS
jgi:hypothetical protein